MALFLAKLCEENSKCLQAFLFDENLLVDIRLLLINELIWKKFNVKFISIGDIDEVFRRIQVRKFLLVYRKIKMLVFLFIDCIDTTKCMYKRIAERSVS